MDLVDQYLWVGSRRVKGWLAPFSARFIASLARSQIRNRITGGVAEIGVHHGRLFILMHLTSQSGQSDIAIDIFGNQELNSDHSGKGDLERFLGNLQRWGGRPADVVIVQKSSLELTPEDILKAVGQVRLFSVDGGHTAECAFNDLNLAQSVLCKGGIIVLDDFFNEYWPEVASGTVKFLTSSGCSILPFAITPGKTYFAAADDCDDIRTIVRDTVPARYYDKTCSILGSEVHIYGSAASRSSRWRQFRAAAAETELGVMLRRAKRLVVHPRTPLGPKAYDW
jgi:Methyltransferase domain